MSASQITDHGTVQGILSAACEAREMLILATPYLNFESNFLRLEKDVLHVRITMGAEEATFGLKSSDLRLRFPYSTRFLEGHTRMLGFGMVDSRKTIRLAAPKMLQDDELRGAYRVERVGRVLVTYSTERFDIRSANLINLSTTGAKITALQDFSDMDIRIGGVISVSIPMNDEIRINAKCAVRWIHGRTLGLSFEPTLAEQLLTPLSRWIFQKREEDRDQIRRGAVLASVARPARGANEGEVMLVSSSQTLESELAQGWSDLPPLKRIASSTQQVKDALQNNPSLFIFHVTSGGLDERRRIKMLAECVKARTPFVLLGTEVENHTLFDMGTELKATSVFGFSGKPSMFFFRLIQGIVRRHHENADSSSSEGQ